jgi:hypothetical protein
MSSGPHGPPIRDGELLYRRVPKSTNWFHPGDPPEIDDEAFRPHRTQDATGLSMQRARTQEHPEFMSAEEAAKGRSAAGYVLAVLNVGELRALGIEVEPRPIEGQPGHVEFPQLTSANRESEQTTELMRKLAACVLRVECP